MHTPGTRNRRGRAATGIAESISFGWAKSQNAEGAEKGRGGRREKLVTALRSGQAPLAKVARRSQRESRTVTAGVGHACLLTNVTPEASQARPRTSGL